MIAVDEIAWTAVRAQGAGGQNVNKVASAIHLRFDVHASSLPEAIKARLLASGDQRITPAGVVIIKAQRHRTQERNLADALARLQELVDAAALVPQARKPHPAYEELAAQTRRQQGEARQDQGCTPHADRIAGADYFDRPSYCVTGTPSTSSPSRTRMLIAAIGLPF